MHAPGLCLCADGCSGSGAHAGAAGPQSAHLDDVGRGHLVTRHHIFAAAEAAPRAAAVAGLHCQHRKPHAQRLLGVRHLLRQAQALGTALGVVGPAARGVVVAAVEHNKLQAGRQAGGQTGGRGQARGQAESFESSHSQRVQRGLPACKAAGSSGRQGQQAAPHRADGILGDLQYWCSQAEGQACRLAVSRQRRGATAAGRYSGGALCAASLHRRSAKRSGHLSGLLLCNLQASQRLLAW